MPDEVLAALRPWPGGRFLDGTLGGAGHAFLVLRAASPDGSLIGFDRDEDAIAAATERLRPFADRVRIIRDAFWNLGDHGIADESIDGVLLDLGVSSFQLDTGSRGFSVRNDGPLDMRMDRRQALTAAVLVAESDAARLKEIFRDYGDVREAGRIARVIVREREREPITTTGRLAAVVEQATPRRGRKTHPATLVFQALRIAVNGELDRLPEGLEAVWRVLKPGGRLAVITFHSLEDRLVKRWARPKSLEFEWDEGAGRPDWARPRRVELIHVSRKAIKPGEAELESNPRSRSAQLRVFEKI